MDKWDAEYDEEKARFQEIAFQHEQRQQDIRDKITDAKNELRAIQEKDDAYAKLQEQGETGGATKGDVARRALKEAAESVAAIIEVAGTGSLEQATEQLNLLRAKLGCSLHHLPRRRQEEQGDDDQGKETRRGGLEHGGAAPSSGRWKSKGQEGTGQGGPMGGQEAEERKAQEGRREAKLAARARGEGSAAAMDTDQGPTGGCTEAAIGTAAAEEAKQRAEAEEAMRKRALDAIRGRLLLEKHRKLADKQKELIAAGLLPEPHEWTEEQLRQNQRQIEMFNAEVDAEAHREIAAMSSEARAQLLEAAAK